MISSIGKSGARSSGPTGSPVPGCSTGCGALGMSARMLYQRRGSSSSPSRNFVCSTPRAYPWDAGIVKLESGDFGAITSVVVFRDGEISLERYLAGDAETRRNTRSATKTVTGMLVGLAGTDPAARVLSLLPDRRVANPDDRKDAITVEDLLTM